MLFIFHIQIGSTQQQHCRPLINLTLVEFFIQQVSTFLQILDDCLITLGNGIARRLVFRIGYFGHNRHSQRSSSILGIRIAEETGQVEQGKSTESQGLAFQVVEVFRIILTDIQSVYLRQNDITILDNLIGIRPVGRRTGILCIVQHIVAGGTLSGLYGLRIVTRHVSVINHTARVIVGTAHHVVDTVQAIFHIIQILYGGFSRNLCTGFNIKPVIATGGGQADQHPHHHIF